MHHTRMHYCMIETPWTEPPPCPNPPQMCGKEQAVCILLECMNYLGCISDKVGITSENFGCISDAFRTVFRTVFRKKVTWYECCNLIGSEDFASPPDVLDLVCVLGLKFLDRNRTKRHLICIQQVPGRSKVTWGRPLVRRGALWVLFRIQNVNHRQQCLLMWLIFVSLFEILVVLL